MACDRFIKWKNISLSIDEIEYLLKRYIHTSGTVERRNSVLFAILHGEKRYVLREEFDTIPYKQGGCADGGRWFEVYCPESNNPHGYDVITRSADEFTTALADGFVKLLELYDGEWLRSHLKDTC